MASTGFTIFQSSFVNYLIVQARNTLDPLTIVDQNVYGPNPASELLIQFNNLEPGVYQFYFYNSPDGVSLGSLIAPIFTLDVKETGVSEVPRFYLGGGPNAVDPVADQDTLTDPYLDDKTIRVYQPGFGELDPATEYQRAAGGVVQLLNGRIFGDAEKWVIVVANPVNVPTTVSRSFVDFMDFTTNKTFDSTCYGKVLEANASNIITLTITDVSAIPDKTYFGINTDNGTQRYAVLQLPVGQTCMVYGVARNTVYVGRGEQALFQKKGGIIKLLSWSGDHRRLGDFVSRGGFAPLNSLPTTGGWYLKDDYPRLFYWYVNALPGGELGTGTQDVTPNDANKTKWIIGTTKFWVPDNRDYFERVAPSGTNAGVNALGQVGNHKHWIATNEQLNSFVDPTSDKPMAYQRNDSGDYKYKLGASNNPAIFGLTSDPTSGSGTENYPKYRTTNEYVII